MDNSKTHKMAPQPRIWLITGCSSGFGLELAKIASSRGDKVLAASRNPNKVNTDSNPNISPVRLDHNEPLDFLKETAKSLFKIHGRIDIIVNNAAYVQTGTIEEAAEETYAQFQSNLFGPLNLYRAFLPHLRQQGSGTLVTIGSMACWYTMKSCNLYNASKAALRWAALGLGQEVKPFGIKHCLIEPGFFRTSLLKPESNFSSTTTSTRIEAYDGINAKADAAFKAFDGSQLGNPVKGAEVIYEVVTSTGVTKGRHLPEFLPLGSDATEEIGKACRKTMDALEEWKEISALSDFPQGK
ncbi:putative oxidoreductase [Podospora fimiseda]|uniref:Oxidoreductase n=1 Tax=Podospora fimiseda TaxID=252190 RepID=A0AAN7BM96_9PEZI|nr:putative oxidoreductase [Podospora fimiseda]